MVVGDHKDKAPDSGGSGSGNGSGSGSGSGGRPNGPDIVST
jgi:hypothetical protein